LGAELAPGGHAVFGGAVVDDVDQGQQQGVDEGVEALALRLVQRGQLWGGPALGAQLQGQGLLGQKQGAGGNVQGNVWGDVWIAVLGVGFGFGLAFCFGFGFVFVFGFGFDLGQGDVQLRVAQVVVAGVVQLQGQALGGGGFAELGLVEAEHAFVGGQFVFVLLQGAGQGVLLLGGERGGGVEHGAQQDAGQALHQLPVAGAQLHVGGNALRVLASNVGVERKALACLHAGGPALQCAGALGGAGQLQGDGGLLVQAEGQGQGLKLAARQVQALDVGAVVLRLVGCGGQGDVVGGVELGVGGKELGPAMLQVLQGLGLGLQFFVAVVVVFELFLHDMQLVEQEFGFVLGFFEQGLGFAEFGLGCAVGFLGFGGFGALGLQVFLQGGQRGGKGLGLLGFFLGLLGFVLRLFDLVLGLLDLVLRLLGLGLRGFDLFLSGFGLFLRGFQAGLGLAELGLGGGQGFLGFGGLGGLGLQVFLELAQLGGFGAAVAQGLVAGEQLRGVGGQAVGLGWTQGLDAGVQVGQQLLHGGLLLAQVLRQVLGQGAGFGRGAAGWVWDVQAQAPALGHVLGQGVGGWLGLVAPDQQAALGVAQGKAQQGLVLHGPLLQGGGGVALGALAQQGLGGAFGHQDKAHGAVKVGPEVEQVLGVGVGPGPLGVAQVAEQQVGGELFPHAAGLGAAGFDDALVPAVQGDLGVACEGFGRAQAQGLQALQEGGQVGGCAGDADGGQVVSPGGLVGWGLMGLRGVCGAC